MSQLRFKIPCGINMIPVTSSVKILPSQSQQKVKRHFQFQVS